MNLNGLARHYENLRPDERLALIVKASLRGDTVEQDRLIQSAPTALYRLPDHHPQADALQILVLFHVIGLLEQAVLYWRSLALLAASGDGKDQAAQDRKLGIVRFNAFLFVVHCDAWRLLAAEMRVDVEGLLRDAPGYADGVRPSEPGARELAFTHEEAVAWLRAAEGQAEVTVSTAEDIAEVLRDLLAQRTEKWG